MMFAVALIYLAGQASLGFCAPLFDGVPYVYSYPSTYFGGYPAVYRHQPILEPLSYGVYQHGQPVAVTSTLPEPLVYQQQPIESVPYPVIAPYYGHHGYQQPGYVLAYQPVSEVPAQEPAKSEPGPEEKKEVAEGDEKMDESKIMSRSGPTSIEAEMTAAESEVKMETAPPKEYRIFNLGSVYPFGTNYNYKQPVLVNGNQGQKVSVLNNQYLLKLASTTKNRDGTLAGAVYPEIGGGTLFNTPASNYNGR